MEVDLNFFLKNQNDDIKQMEDDLKKKWKTTFKKIKWNLKEMNITRRNNKEHKQGYEAPPHTDIIQAQYNLNPAQPSRTQPQLRRILQLLPQFKFQSLFKLQDTKSNHEKYTEISQLNNGLWLQTNT